MSNYTKSTNFATKDNLTPGDPLKVVRGTEIDTEYNNIATAIATKTDNASAAITGGSITGITDLAVADGGTGASTAAGGLNNLLPSQTGNANKYLQSDGTNASWDAVSLSTADITGTLGVANGGTGVTTSTGTTNVVLSNSPTLVTPALGTPSALVGTNITGTASGLTAGNVTTNANLTGAITSTGNATSLGSFSSANLRSALTDETGTGSAVFATSPTLVTPTLGVATATSLQGIIGNVTPATGSFTTVDASGAVTLSGGTANGVAYLNGSKVLTTGSALTFDGTNKFSILSAAASDGFQISNGGASPATFYVYTGSLSYGASIGNGLTGGGDSIRFDPTVRAQVFNINSSEQMRLTSSGLEVKQSQLIGYSSYAGIGTNGLAVAGNVGIGTSSPGATLDVNGNIRSVGTTQNRSILITNNSGTFELAHRPDISASMLSSTATPIIIAAGGVNYLSLNTNGSERARIDSSGNLLVGTTSPAGKITIAQTASSAVGLGVDIQATSTKFCNFSYQGTGVGSITYNGTLTVYGTTSDYRLKTVIGPVANAGQRIDALQPVEYTWNASGERTRGFLAHQFQEVYAGSVSGTKDAVDAEGKPVYQAMQASTSEVIADLVAELQSLRARVAQLESN